MFAGGMTELLGSLGIISIAVLVVLLGFSVFSWGIVFYKWKIYKAVDRQEMEFLQEFRLNPLDFRKLRHRAKNLSASPSGAIFLSVIERLDPEPELFPKSGDGVRNGRIPQRPYLEKVIQYTMQNRIHELESFLPFLATTGNITPFIGLLGTVLGIINAFQEIGVQGTASIGAVAPGVAEALVATAAGLFTAIPAVVAYNYFLTRIRRTVFRAEAFSIEFLNSCDEQLRETAEVAVVR